MIRGRRRDWFLDVIDDYFKSNSHVTSTIGYFRPSALSQCIREMQYSYIGVAKYPDNSLSSIKRMVRGIWHHDMWEKIFINSGIPVKVGKDYPVSCLCPCIMGTSDIIIENSLGDNQLIDFKSYANAYSPPWGHLAQWSMYAYLLNMNYGMNVSKGWLVREDPISLELEPFPVKLEMEFILDIMHGLRVIERYSVEKLMFPKDMRCGTKRAWGSGCSLYDFCNSEKGDNPW